MYQIWFNKPICFVQIQVPSSKVLFNPKCMFSCDEDGPNRCDTAIMELDASQVPEDAKKAALEVYRWDDEKGMKIDTFGYGATGNAGKLSTVCIMMRVVPVHDVLKQNDSTPAVIKEEHKF